MSFEIKLKIIHETHATVVECKGYAKDMAEINKYSEHRLGTVHNQKMPQVELFTRMLQQNIKKSSQPDLIV